MLILNREMFAGNPMCEIRPHLNDNNDDNSGTGQTLIFFTNSRPVFGSE